MSDIDTAALKAVAPLIPYIEEHYKDRITIERRTKGTVFAKCLWHEENTASLAFFDNGTYKCFGGCGAHGDIISLVQYLENVTFEEACKIIGDNVGYEVILEPPNPFYEAYKDEMDNHSRRYWNNLQKTPDALNYLMNVRGILPDFINMFRLGFTDAEEYKYRTLGGISSRISFPILEHKRKNPKCIGMAYRSITDEQPKYLNDPNQDGREGQNKDCAGVFIKGDILYGLPMAYEGIKKFGYVIITEGYFDVISLHQSIYSNAVSTMGTSLTDQHIKTLSRVTSNVLLMYDSDSAGLNGMFKSIMKLFSSGINVAVCVFESGKDPADVCKAAGFSYHKVTSMINANTMHGIDFCIDRAVKKYEAVSMKERMRAIEQLGPIIDSVQSEMVRDMYKHKAYKRLDME